jgi:tetratricopeptide (TPR) repeat protein
MSQPKALDPQDDRKLASSKECEQSPSTDVASDCSTKVVSAETPKCRSLALEGEQLIRRGKYLEAISVLETAVMVGSEDYQLLSILWSLLGRCHYSRGDYEKADACHTHDLAISTQCEDLKGQSQAYCNLGIVNRKLGCLSKAFVCFKMQLSLANDMMDSAAVQKAQFNLGEIHLLLGRLALGLSGKVDDNILAKEHLEESVQNLESHLKHGQRCVSTTRIVVYFPLLTAVCVRILIQMSE